MHAGDGCNLGEVTICNATRSCTRMNATGCRGSSVKSTVQIDARGAKSRPDNPYICLLHVDWRTDAPTIELKDVNEARRTMEMKIELEDSPFTDPSKSRCAVGNVQPNIGCPSCRVQEYSLGGSECIACSVAMECDFKGTFSYSELHQIKHCIKSCLTCINGAASEGAPITAGTCGHTRGVRWAYATGKLGFSVLAALGYWNAGYACTCIFAPRALAHTHTRACVRAHTRAGTHAHMHPHLHTHARMHARKHASTHARTHERTPTRTSTHTHTHTHTQILVRVCVHVLLLRTCLRIMCVFIHARTYMGIHSCATIHACMRRPYYRSELVRPIEATHSKHVSSGGDSYISNERQVVHNGTKYIAYMITSAAHALKASGHMTNIVRCPGGAFACPGPFTELSRKSSSNMTGSRRQGQKGKSTGAMSAALSELSVMSAEQDGLRWAEQDGPKLGNRCV